MKEIILALGTNLGDRLQNLQEALAHLAPEVLVTRVSSVYETEPWGYADQPRFLNQVVLAQTELKPLALLRYVKQIEDALKRVKTIRNGPRTIDLDILFYDDIILESETLTIPHPRLAERAFVMVPLAEIAPDFIHPVLKKSMPRHPPKYADCWSGPVSIRNWKHQDTNLGNSNPGRCSGCT